MAVKIRLKRMGKKKVPLYRIVVADSRSPRNGRFIEEIGFYDPTKEPSEIRVDEEAAKKWLATGAQPTQTADKILKIAGIKKQKIDEADSEECAATDSGETGEADSEESGATDSGETGEADSEDDSEDSSDEGIS